MDKNEDEPTRGDLPNKGTLKADATRDKVSRRHQSFEYWQRKS